MKIAQSLVLVALLAGCGVTTDTTRLPAERDVALVYAALGDSTVEGVGASTAATTYVARLAERVRTVYPHARVTNLGVAGATSADVLATQVPAAIALGPHLVTLSIGPNDVTSGVTAETYERNVRAILGHLAEATHPVVVVSLLPDLAVTPRFRGRPEAEAVGRASARFNTVLRRAAREHGAEVVDLFTPSRDEVPRRPALVAGDGYHPSDVGHARWADLMWQGIAARLAR